MTGVRINLKLDELTPHKLNKFRQVLLSYRGPVCVEVEDRAYEGSAELRELSLQQSLTFLRNFVPRLEITHG